MTNTILVIILLAGIPLVFGLLLGFAIAYRFTAHKVAKSNVLGDSKARFRNFAASPLQIKMGKDNVRLPK